MDYFCHTTVRLPKLRTIFITTILWSFRYLTHWCWDTTSANLQPTFSNVLSRKKMYEFRLKISLKFVPKGLINNMTALVQIMAWRRSGDKPLFEPMMFESLTHLCVTRPKCVNMHPSRRVVMSQWGSAKERRAANWWLPVLRFRTETWDVNDILIHHALTLELPGPLSRSHKGQMIWELWCFLCC